MIAHPAEPIRIVYFGTPGYAVPALEALQSDPRVSIALVVTQPDRPAGRGRKLTSPPVKDFAIARGVEVYQPETLRTETDRGPIAALGADLFVVAAYGKIFGPKLLALSRLGSINLHASLLPLYRGASPISAAILEGRSQTGVTLMRMDAGLDTGPVLAQQSLDIASDATTASLTPDLAQLGARMLIDRLDALVDRSDVSTPQSEHAASLTRPLVKADGWIDWNKSAIEIERQVRAMWDWPRGWTTLRGELVQIHRASVISVRSDSAPGTVIETSNLPVVATGNGQLEIEIAQNAGSGPLTGAMWLLRSGAVGEVLGVSGAPKPPELPMIRPVMS